MSSIRDILHVYNQIMLIIYFYSFTENYTFRIQFKENWYFVRLRKPLEANLHHDLLRVFRTLPYLQHIDSVRRAFLSPPTLEYDLWWMPLAVHWKDTLIEVPYNKRRDKSHLFGISIYLEFNVIRFKNKVILQTFMGNVFKL